MKSSRPLPFLITIAILAAAPANAQQNPAAVARPGAPPQTPDPAAARAVLESCIAAAEAAAAAPPTGSAADARALAERAEQAFRALIGAQPNNPDAHVGLAEALSRCVLPHAGMTGAMRVIEQSLASLQTALALEPRHWQGRFLLAMNYFHMPAFLNRTPDAIRELETLRAQQGARNDQPHYGLTWRYLGDAYERAGRRGDAQAAFAAGAKLFPEDAALQERARAAGAPAAGTPEVPTASGEEPPAVYALAPLRVEGTQHQLEEARSSTALRRVDVYTMPGGTAEMLQTLQALPGATRAGDGVDLYVRGGDPEETPVFVNGGRLAFPGRWEGLNGSSMGVLEASVLSRAYFSAGGFSAKYGNALSGVVDVETQGRPQEAYGRVGINTVSAGASLFRPVGARAGLWTTAMLTDVTLVARMQGQSDKYPDMPRSYQAVAGGSFNPVPGIELKALALAAGDESSRIIDTGAYHGTFASDGATQHGALSARWLRGDGRAGATASVTGSRRAGGFQFGVLQRDRTDHAWGARIDGDLVTRGGLRFRGGLELARVTAATEGTVPLTPNVAPGSPAAELPGDRESADHAGVYLEAEHTLGRSLVAVVGARADRLPGEDEVTLDPRAALAYTSGAWTLRGGAGMFHQGSWRRRYQLPDAGTPTGAPTRARHLVLGAERAGEPALRVEAYTKQYDRYAPGEGGGPALASGSARGLDAMVRWQQQARLNGWVTYSLIDAEGELVSGEQVRARYDVTHSLTLVGRFALSESWELGATGRYATGKPYTPIIGAIASPQEGWPLEPVPGAIHGERLPYYGRLDARLTRFQKIGDHTGVFYLEMLDLNGRRNIMGYQYDATYTERRPVDSFFAHRTFVLGAELRF